MNKIKSLSSLCKFAALALFVMLIALPALDANAMGRKDKSNAVLFKAFAIQDENLGQLKIAVWIPSMTTRTARGQINGWGIYSPKLRDKEKVMSISCPVILISHDIGMHRLINADIASSLAASGFVVISVTHIGESLDDMTSVFSAGSFFHRPRQLASALNFVSKDPRLGHMLDLNRVGTLGVGSGALTALQLAGVDINIIDYANYCASPNAEEMICTKWAQERFADLPTEAAFLKGKYGQYTFTPATTQIKSVALMAPGWLIFADKISLQNLKVPLAVLYAENEEIYFKPDVYGPNAFYPVGLPSLLRIGEVKGVDHYGLNAICSPKNKGLLEDMCSSLDGGEFSWMQGKRNPFLIDFFKDSLGEPVEIIMPEPVNSTESAIQNILQ